MASHEVAIAKASLAAGLLRPDPTSISRDEITALHTTLDRALSQCSSANIQTCKQWLLSYVVSSSNRVSLLAKYLVTLSRSFAEDNANNSNNTKPTRPSAKRKRLHMLYLLNDLFHHTKYHESSTAAFSGLSGSLQPHIVDLLSSAASYDREKHPKHHRRLDELLDIWQEHGYFSAEYVGKLREVVANSAVSGPVRTSTTPSAEVVEPDRKLRDGPFVMPPTHGDPSIPYYDLPAGNLIPHMVPNSSVPLRPDMIKPLQFLAGPADGKLVNALKAFLEDVDRIYAPGESEIEVKSDEVVDVDELGQTVIRDVISGEILDGETYYGWTRSFCNEMKKRNARSPRRSESRSRSPPKRRRYSDSSDDSRYRSSRSRTPPRDSRRYSRSRSRTPQQSRSREKSYSPAPAPSLQPQLQHQNQHPQQKHQQNPYAQHPGYHPPPPQMPFPPSANAFPPPPPNYPGQWPPPPPPSLPNFPPNFPPHYPPGQQHMPQMPPAPGSYHFPPQGPPSGPPSSGPPTGRGWHQHPPPPPPAGRGWR
ncbi:hypothetical protein BJY04DRAFT_213787 [Aspergillus karnatakaensis]|uniref:RNA polymerase II-binding domain-containing protein n=1 Tax=Aspergillus karnatakaensis TaxID=1810916 RepID=UPI003CCCDE9A